MKKSLLTIALFSAWLYSEACSCFYISDYFCPTVSHVLGEGWALDHVIRGTVESKSGYYMDVVIKDNILGEIEQGDTITILGQDGLNCNEFLGWFEPGMDVILALNYSGWEPGVYDLSGCGKFFLFVENEMVTGNIAQDQSPIGYEEFRNTFEGHCAGITSAGEAPGALRPVVFPNPTADVVNISNLSPDSQHLISFFDLSGKLLREEIAGGAGNYQVNTGNLPAGIYILRIRSAAVVFSQKIVISDF